MRKAGKGGQKAEVTSKNIWVIQIPCPYREEMQPQKDVKNYTHFLHVYVKTETDVFCRFLHYISASLKVGEFFRQEIIDPCFQGSL